MSSIVNLNKHSKGKTNIKTLDIFQKKKSEGWIPNVFDRVRVTGKKDYRQPSHISLNEKIFNKLKQIEYSNP